MQADKYLPQIHQEELPNIATILPNGIIETREYDELYRLIGVDNTDVNGNILSNYDYTLDEMGHRILVEELNV